VVIIYVGENLDLGKEIIENLNNFLNNIDKLLIMGVGNTLKGDDGVGIEFIHNLINYYSNKYNISNNKEINKINNKIVFLNCGVVPENFTDVIKKENPSHIIIYDAALMGEIPGTLKIIKLDNISSVGFSTHALPMNIIIKYINSFIDTQILIIGIEPEQLEFGNKLSKKIYKKNEKFIKLIIKYIDSILENEQ